jgi:predicted DNA-binding protein
MCCTCAIFSSKLKGGIEMATPTRHEAMQRKPILMPPEMISKVDRIARGRNISFAEVVREAVEAFNGDASAENTALIEALAETMIRTTQEVINKIDAVEKRLDKTHAMLEGK